MALPPVHVVAGEPIRADYVNNLIDYIRTNITPTSSPQKSPLFLACACINDDAEIDILAGEPVYIDTTESRFNVNTPILHVLPYDGTQDYPVAVARFDMGAGASGEVILSGLAVVKVAEITAGAYLQPTEDGEFEFTDDATPIRLIGSVTQSDDTSSTSKVLAMIDNGAGGGIGSLGVITTRPSGGAGSAAWQTVTLDANGSWTASGTDIPVIIPQF